MYEWARPRSLLGSFKSHALCSNISRPMFSLRTRVSICCRIANRWTNGMREARGSNSMIFVRGEFQFPFPFPNSIPYAYIFFLYNRSHPIKSWFLARRPSSYLRHLLSPLRFQPLQRLIPLIFHNSPLLEICNLKTTNISHCPSKTLFHL